MSAKRAFLFVIGLVLLAFGEGMITLIYPAFPIMAVLGFQATVSGSILSTKLINDIHEMKYGIQTKDEGATNGGCE